MQNDLLNYLTSSPKHANISPEALEMMGKQAANMFLDTGLSLNEAVVKLAADHNDINPEQLKRVAEFANTAVYLAKHDQSKTAGDNSSYPQFELADPGRIIQDLTDGARPNVVTKTDLDYSKQPEKKSKVSSAQSDALLEEMFQTKEASERADLDFSRDTAVDEVMSAKEMLVAGKEHLASIGEKFDMMFKEASEEFYAEAKNHLLDGGSFADVLLAAHSSGVGKEKVSTALQPFITRLLKEKVSSAKRLSEQARELSKVAHRSINEDHPMVSSFRVLLSADAEIEKIATALDTVDQELKAVNGFIRETFLAGKAR